MLGLIFVGVITTAGYVHIFYLSKATHVEIDMLWLTLQLLAMFIHAISHTVRQNLTEFWPFWTPFPIRFSKLTEFSYHLISYVLKN